MLIKQRDFSMTVKLPTKSLLSTLTIFLFFLLSASFLTFSSAIAHASSDLWYSNVILEKKWTDMNKPYGLRPPINVTLKYKLNYEIPQNVWYTPPIHLFGIKDTDPYAFGAITTNLWFKYDAIDAGAPYMDPFNSTVLAVYDWWQYNPYIEGLHHESENIPCFKTYSLEELRRRGTTRLYSPYSIAGSIEENCDISNIYWRYQYAYKPEMISRKFRITTNKQNFLCGWYNVFTPELSFCGDYVGDFALTMEMPPRYLCKDESVCETVRIR